MDIRMKVDFAIMAVEELQNKIYRLREQDAELAGQIHISQKLINGLWKDTEYILKRLNEETEKND
jgi:hypothetical protein